VSIYGVHKLLKRAQRDDVLCTELQRDPTSVLAQFPLNEAERAALLAGDVMGLHRMGVHGYLLQTLARRQLFGMTPQRYIERMHAAL
jgi:hypothetical protein